MSRTSSFEQVAELLWTGTMPIVDRPVAEPPITETSRRAVAAVRWPGPERRGARPADGGRSGARQPDIPASGPTPRRVGSSASCRSCPVRAVDGSVAERLAHAWHPSPTPELVGAIDRALVLLADHELATSTLAVQDRRRRCARTPTPRSAAGVATLTGALHGSSAEDAAALLSDAAERGPVTAIRGVLDAGRRLPGFGHSVYRTGDPRLEPLLESVRSLPDAAGRFAVVDDVIREASGQIVARPNVDLGLAALSFVGGLAAGCPALRRRSLAGWAAHIDEELLERPLRFRGVARAPA